MYMPSSIVAFGDYAPSETQTLAPVCCSSFTGDETVLKRMPAKKHVMYRITDERVHQLDNVCEILMQAQGSISKKP